MNRLESNADLTEVEAGHQVPLRRAVKRPIPGKPDAYRHLAFLKEHLADGEIDGKPFTLCIGLNGWLELVFEKDYDNGRFLINPQDFVEAAYEALQARTDDKQHSDG